MKPRLSPDLPPLLAYVLIPLATLLAYLPVMSGGGFIWDDDVYISRNPLLTDMHGLLTMWNPLATPINYDPLVWSMFWVEWRFFGTSPIGYHVVNVLLHIGACLLIYLVLRRLRFPVAGFAALLFAVHPVNVASVAWISEGKNTLSAIFYALTVLCWMQEWTALCVLCFTLALLAKASGLLLGLALPLLGWWQRGTVSRREMLRAMLLLAIAGAFAAITIHVEKAHILGSVDARPEGVLSRLAAAGMALWFYLYKTIWPLRLSMIYPRWSISGTNPVEWMGTVAFLALVAMLWVRRERLGRGPLVAVAWFVLMLVPVLGVSDTFFFNFSLVADHWQYLAMLATVCLLVYGVMVLPGRPQVAVFVMGTLVLACMVLTGLQCANYASQEALWQATVRAYPDCWVAWYSLGTLAEIADRPQDAEQDYRMAIKVRPQYAPAHENLGVMLRKRGDLDEALAHFEAALDASPRDPEAHYDLGIVLSMKQRQDEALPQYETAVHLLEGPPAATLMAPPDEQARDQAHLYSNYSGALLGAGRLDDAVRAARRASALAPQDADVQFNLGYMLEKQGNAAAAAEQYAAVLAASPDYESALSRLAWVQATSRQTPPRDVNKALPLAQRACDLSNHQESFALDALAAAYAANGHFKNATDTARQAAQLCPPGELRRDIEKRAGLYELMEPYYAP